MMTWLKTNICWVILNLAGLIILGVLLTQGNTNWNTTNTFDSGLEGGKWAIRFLLFCLLMTPLRTYFGWNWAISLRKPAGLWAFGFALLHVIFYILSDIRLTWFTFPIRWFIIFGVLGFIILMALTITSNRWSMRRLGKWWKRLHQLVYVAGLAVTAHAVLAAGISKKILVGDPDAIYELIIYSVILSILLAVRVPFVRQFLKGLRAQQSKVSV